MLAIPAAPRVLPDVMRAFIGSFSYCSPPNWFRMHAERVCAGFYHRTSMIAGLIGTYNWNSADGRWSIKRAREGEKLLTLSRQGVFSRRGIRVWRELLRGFPSVSFFTPRRISRDEDFPHEMFAPRAFSHCITSTLETPWSCAFVSRCF